MSIRWFSLVWQWKHVATRSDGQEILLRGILQVLNFISSGCSHSAFDGSILHPLSVKNSSNEGRVGKPTPAAWGLLSLTLDVCMYIHIYICVPFVTSQSADPNTLSGWSGKKKKISFLRSSVTGSRQLLLLENTVRTGSVLFALFN